MTEFKRRHRGTPAALDLKSADNCLQANDWTVFTLNGDATPNDRFNYPARLAQRNRAEGP